VWASPPHRVRPRLSDGSHREQGSSIGPLKAPPATWSRPSARQNRRGAAVERLTVVHTDSGDQFAIGQLTPRARSADLLCRQQRSHEPRSVTRRRFASIKWIWWGRSKCVVGTSVVLRFQVTGPAVDALVIRRGAATFGAAVCSSARACDAAQAPLSTFVLQPGQEARQIVRCRRGILRRARQQRPHGQRQPAVEPARIVGGNAAVVAYSAELGAASSQF